MGPKLLRRLVLASLLLAAPAPASATTLTVTPDKSTYLVGETITLSVFGDPEGVQGSNIFGRLLFPAELASYADSSQEPLTSFNGSFAWSTGALTGGVGFATAFDQICCLQPSPVDGPLLASVTLLAAAPGVVSYDWLTDSSSATLNFFALTTAPGGSVTIVPEPATGLLVTLGLVATALAARRGRS
jgi:hypothetical protein